MPSLALVNPWRVFNYSHTGSHTVRERIGRTVSGANAKEILEAQSRHYQRAIGRGIASTVVEELRGLAEGAPKRDVYAKYTEVQFVYEMLSTVEWRDKVLKCVNDWAEV